MKKIDWDWKRIFFFLILPVFILSFSPVRETSGYTQNTGSLTDFYNLEPDNPYVIDINITQTVEEGIDITLRQAILDQGQLIYSMLITGDLPDNSVNAFSNDLCYFNGDDQIAGGTEGYPLRIDGEEPTLMLVNSVEFFQSEPQLDADIVAVKLILPYLEIISSLQDGNNEPAYQSYIIEGPWSFEFEVSGEAIAADTEIYELSKIFEAKGETYSTEKLVITPISQRIYGTSTAETPAIDYYSMVTEDGSEISMRLSRSGWKAGDTAYSTIYLTEIGDPESNWTGNAYDIIKKSKTLTLIPCLLNNQTDWRRSIKNTTPLESEAITLTRDQ